MKSKIYILLTLAAAFIVAASYGGNYVFSPSSVLSSGKWVKVETADAGIYELSYARLTQMGFPDPEKVSVYGSGGVQLSDALVSGGKNAFADDLRQVPVIHRNNKLYFYARGLREPKLGADGFSGNSLNIYSNVGHYFLTDRGTTLPLEAQGDVTDLKQNAADRSTGYDWRIREADNMHGLDNCGNEFWDCTLTSGTPLSWNLPVSYMADRSVCSTLSRIILIRNAAGASYTVSLNVGNNSHRDTFRDSSDKEEKGLAREIRTSSFTLTKSSDIRIGASVSSANTDLYFDWTLLTYTKNLGKAGSEMVQERLGLQPSGQTGGNGYVSIPAGALVLDVTDPHNPVLLPGEGNKAYFRESESQRILFAFNPARTQLQPQNPVNVPNQDLHALQQRQYDFLIVAVPEMLEYAERIAQLHRDHDKINVAVATTEQIYNEFSGGTPDPVAVRLMVKMLYESHGNALKNVLLVGPVSSDTRGINHSQPHAYPIIGIQEGGIFSQREPAIVLDYYGNTSDNLSLTAMDRMTVQTGVGALPVHGKDDGERAVSKIRRYLTYLDSDDFAWYVNETVSASCSGDDHLHDDQAVKLGENLQTAVNAACGGRFRHSNFAQEFFSEETQKSYYGKVLESGKLLSVYVGHAGGWSIRFFQAPDFARLRNKLPFFMMFAGCDLTVPDYGDVEMGQEVVTHYNNALIGSFCSTRTAWASGNFNLAKLFTNAFFRDRSNRPYTQSRTIGEVYAQAKSSITDFNKLVFIYIGDPALTVPFPLRAMECKLTGNLTSYRAGDVLTVSGTIDAKEGDAPFNGRAVLKICEPTQTLTSPADPKYKITFSADLISSVAVNVKDGRFTAKIPLPKETARFVSYGDAVTNLNMYVGAYDPSQHLSASCLVTVPMMKHNEVRVEKPSADQTDTRAPVVTARYDAATMSLDMTVADNVALTPGIGAGAALTMRIDDIEVSTGLVADDDICGTTEYRTAYFVGHLKDGEHTLTYSARDMAGNATATKTLNFTVNRDAPGISLAAERSYGIDSMRFIPGSGHTGLQLIVLNAEGRIVDTVDNVDGPFDWDRAGLPSGTYTATLRAPDNRTIRSNSVTFTLID